MRVRDAIRSIAPGRGVNNNGATIRPPAVTMARDSIEANLIEPLS